MTILNERSVEKNGGNARKLPLKSSLNFMKIFPNSIKSRGEKIRSKKRETTSRAIIGKKSRNSKVFFTQFGSPNFGDSLCNGDGKN